MPANQDQLLPDEFLDPNQSITSLNGLYALYFLSNCSLILERLHRYRSGRTVWSPNTYGRPAGRFIMQADGNLVIYDQNWLPIWASNTATPGSRLVIHDDGNLVIYDPNGAPVWTVR